jgi:YVTN family beta-propeller protein
MLSAIATALNPACSAKDEPPPVEQPPVEQCTAQTPLCDPVCAEGSECRFGDGACGCVAIAPTCSADAPICASECGTGFVCAFNDGSCSCVEDVPPVEPPRDLLRRASRSTAVDVTTDDALVAMVNTDDGSVSFFNVAFGAESRSAKVASSNNVPQSEPVSIVIHPNKTEAFVANRATGTVSRIVDINTTQPRVVSEVEVGAEPMGIALTPKGTSAYVTDWVSGNVIVLNTASMSISQTINVGGRPFAVAITNDLDQDENDEKVLVTQFYGRDRADLAIAEALDTGKEGIVQVINVGATSVKKEIALSPIEACFTGNVGTPPVELTSGCFVNQLSAITIHTAFAKTRAYVVSTAASPEGPQVFNHNLQALVSVIDLDAEAEEVALTHNLNTLIKQQQIDNDGNENIGRRFMSSPNGIDFVARDDAAIAYLTSAASDIVLRLEYFQDNTVTVGAPSAFNIVAGQNPQGIVIKHGSSNAGAFVANLISRDLSVLLFRDQRELKKIISTEQPSNPDSAEFKVWKGKRFFNTATAIWSREGWVSCQGCHPMGLTDNVTWKFPSGPHQTISMDGQFASNDPMDMRALNWTAIFDETHDFDNNTRGTAGGKGAVQNADGPIVSSNSANFVSILVEDQTTRENHQGLNGSLKFVTRNNEICSNGNVCAGWDQIDAYVQTIRSPRGKLAAAPAINEGRAIYEEAGCTKCHAGPKWTISRTFYSPEANSGPLGSRIFEANRAFATAMDPSVLRGLPLDVNTDVTLLAGDDSEGGAPAFKRQACNVRNVGTFALAGSAEETREDGSPAMGKKGFNPPSLLAANIGAPYFHNGSAKDLSDLFDARFATHTKAGDPNFAPTAAQKAALIAFLENIDETTEPFAIDPNTILCPTNFTTPR